MTNLICPKCGKDNMYLTGESYRTNPLKHFCRCPDCEYVSYIPDRKHPMCGTCTSFAKVAKHPWNKGDAKGEVSEIMGYACTLQLKENGVVVFMDSDTIGCECHNDISVQTNDFTTQVAMMIERFEAQEMPDRKQPFHEEAEISAGFKHFLEWLRNDHKTFNKNIRLIDRDKRICNSCVHCQTGADLLMPEQRQVNMQESLSLCKKYWTEGMFFNHCHLFEPK